METEGLSVGEDLCLLHGGARSPRAHQFEEGGQLREPVRGIHVHSLLPFSPFPQCGASRVDSSGRKNVPPPPKLLHICARTKPAINPSFCVSVWVLNSTWICPLLEGEIGGDLVTTKGTHRGEWEEARGAKKPKCIHF